MTQGLETTFPQARYWDKWTPRPQQEFPPEETALITLTIDGREVKAKRGATVLEVAQGAGIYIPTLCAHPTLKPFGACRMCLVEIERMRGFPPACTTPASEGMVVKTATPELQKLRREIME